MIDRQNADFKCVAGFVKGPIDNKDKSFSFWVAGRKFVVPATSKHAETLQKAKRALIRFVVTSNRNPVIDLIFAEPSIRQIRQYTESKESN